MRETVSKKSEAEIPNVCFRVKFLTIQCISIDYSSCCVYAMYRSSSVRPCVVNTIVVCPAGSASKHYFHQSIVTQFVTSTSHWRPLHTLSVFGCHSLFWSSLYKCLNTSLPFLLLDAGVFSLFPPSLYLNSRSTAPTITLFQSTTRHYETGISQYSHAPV